jgi:hypothetical protein
MLNKSTKHFADLSDQVKTHGQHTRESPTNGKQCRMDRAFEMMKELTTAAIIRKVAIVSVNLKISSSLTISAVARPLWHLLIS